MQGGCYDYKKESDDLDKRLVKRRLTVSEDHTAEVRKAKNDV